MAANDSKSFEKLRRCIQTQRIIDHHAHNLLIFDNMISEDLLSITSEASDEALQAVRTTLPHRRAMRQLNELYDLPSKATWEAIVAARTARLKNDFDDYVMTCLAGTETILIDDGFDEPDVLESYQWHSQFTQAPCKRIIRIDTAAEDILVDMADRGELPLNVSSMTELKDASQNAWQAFVDRFEKTIEAAIEDREVVAFKSGICFSTGLQVNPMAPEESRDGGYRSFQNEYLPRCRQDKFGLEFKGMNDAILNIACCLISSHSTSHLKPLQFHTGFGGSNIRIPLSNAALLQPLIETYPTIPIVLLHASYPYAREASLLTSLYANVYMDLSAVFPEVSRDGQENVLRQCLEIVPWEKLMWSTDGHAHPETYWLTNRQGREAMENVFCDFVRKGDLDEDEAVEAVKCILFENANKLYRLGLEA